MLRDKEPVIEDKTHELSKDLNIQIDTLITSLAKTQEKIKCSNLSKAQIFDEYMNCDGQSVKQDVTIANSTNLDNVHKFDDNFTSL